MIIPDNKEDEKAEDAVKRMSINDPPPTYVSSESATTSMVQAEPSESPAPRRQACNLVSFVRQNNSVKGSYVIDPSIYIPPSLRPPLQKDETEEDRKNIKLVSHNGSVDADILLMDGGESNSNVGGDSKELVQTARTTVSLKSHNGWVNARVGAVDTESGRRPFYVHATSQNGSVHLYLPRSFQGFMTLTSKHGSIVFSPAFTENLTVFSDIDSTERCFVGDLTSWVDRDVEWAGDEVVATTANGKVKIFYIDEVKGEKDRKNFLMRLFGM